MLKDLLKEDFIILDVEAKDYKDAIKIAINPLEINNYVNENYYYAILNSLEENGAYIDIGKNIALPHARPENGVNKTGITFCRLKENVILLNEKHKIKMLFGLAAEDNNSHLDALSELVSILNDDKNVEILKNGSKEEIINLIKNS